MASSDEVQYCRVIYPHDGCTASDVLSVATGDVLEVLEAQGEWWIGRHTPRELKFGPITPKTGFFYRKFTAPLETQERLAKASNSQSSYAVTYMNKDYISVSPPGYKMKCIICQNLASEAHKIVCCGQTVCLACARAWNKRNFCCPQCRRLNLTARTVSNECVDRSIANLKVRCQNHRRGCEWVGRLIDAESHLQNDCQEVMVKCGLPECSMEVPKHDLQEHISECQYGLLQVQCPCCGITVDDSPAVQHPGTPEAPTLFTASGQMRSKALTHQILVTLHYKECSLWPVKCPKRCSEPNLTRSSLQDHLDKDCSEQFVYLFSENWDGIMVKRKELESLKSILEAKEQHMTDSTEARSSCCVLQ